MEDVLMICLESRKWGARGSHACAESLTPAQRSEGRHPFEIASLSFLIKENIERQQERSNTISDLGIHPT